MEAYTLFKYVHTIYAECFRGNERTDKTEPEELLHPFEWASVACQNNGSKSDSLSPAKVGNNGINSAINFLSLETMANFLAFRLPFNERLILSVCMALIAQSKTIGSILFIVVIALLHSHVNQAITS